MNLIPSTAQRRRWFEIVISGLIIPTYLHFWNSNRLSWVPACGHFWMRLGIWIAICALQSNIQNSGHGWLLETSGKGFGIANFDFPHYYSWDYLKMDSFNSLSYLILHAWDSVPDGSSYGSISCRVCVCVGFSSIRPPPLSLSLSVYLSISLSLCLSACLPAWLCLCVCMSACLPAFLPSCQMSACLYWLCVSVSVCVCVCVCFCLSVSLSVSLSLSLSVYRNKHTHRDKQIDLLTPFCESSALEAITSRINYVSTWEAGGDLTVRHLGAWDLGHWRWDRPRSSVPCHNDFGFVQKHPLPCSPLPMGPSLLLSRFDQQQSCPCLPYLWGPFMGVRCSQPVVWKHGQPKLHDYRLSEVFPAAGQRRKASETNMFRRLPVAALTCLMLHSEKQLPNRVLCSAIL